MTDLDQAAAVRQAVENLNLELCCAARREIIVVIETGDDIVTLANPPSSGVTIFPVQQVVVNAITKDL